MRNQEILGVDVGGVIIDRANDGTDTSFFSDNYLNTTAVPGAFVALGQLNATSYRGRIHVVSTCGQRIQEKTVHWFYHHHFFRRTHIEPSQVHFCRERHEKAAICTQLGITQFIDDRLEVLSHLSDVACRLLFQGRPDEIQPFAEHLPLVTRVESWNDVLKTLS